jgi:hypothetical protein
LTLADRCLAGPDWLPIEKDGAGSTFAFAAAVFAASQSQIVAEYAKQRSLTCDGQFPRLRINDALDRLDHGG